MAGSIVLGVDRIANVLRALGRPEATFPCIHVAGTNGKGSVCALLAAACRAAGYSTGRFVSPYLTEPRDAVTIDGEPVSAEAWGACVARVAAAARELAPAGAADPDGYLTTFELWTAAAFLAFASAAVDVAVVEVGVGGGADATNVIPPPLAAVITPVAMDHQALLGGTLRAIAAAKAGIIKPGGWAVTTARQSRDALEVITAAAAAAGAPLEVVPPLSWLAGAAGAAGAGRARVALDAPSGARFPLGLRGDFQLENAALALAALRHVARAHAAAFGRLTDEAIAAGFAAAAWRGRFERVRVTPLLAPPGGSGGGGAALECWLDGGHNAHALAMLRQEVDALLAASADEGGGAAGVGAEEEEEEEEGERGGAPGTRRRRGGALFIYGGTDSRDVGECVATLLRPGDALFAVPFPSPSGMPWVRCHAPAAVVAAARAVLGPPPQPPPGGAGCGGSAVAFASLADAVAAAAALQAAAGGDDAPRVTLICGSLYLVSEACRTLRVEDSGEPHA